MASVIGWASASHCTARLEVAVAAVAQGDLGVAARDRRGGGDAGGDLLDRGGELVVGEDPARPARAAGPPRPRTVRPVSSSSRALASPDDVRQQVGRGHARVHPELHEGRAQPGARGGVPDVAGQGQAEAGADRRPVDRGDGGHLELRGSRARRGRTPSSGCAGSRPRRPARSRSSRCCRPSRTRVPSPVTTTTRTRPVRRQLVDRRAPRRPSSASDMALRWSGLSRTSRTTPSDGRSRRRWSRVSGVVGHVGDMARRLPLRRTRLAPAAAPAWIERERGLGSNEVRAPNPGGFPPTSPAETTRVNDEEAVMAETWSGEFYCVKCKEKREAERRGQGQRQGHPDGQGRLPRLRHQPEPHPRQGLTQPVSSTADRHGGTPPRRGPAVVVPSLRPRGLWTAVSRRCASPQPSVPSHARSARSALAPGLRVVRRGPRPPPGRAVRRAAGSCCRAPTRRRAHARRAPRRGSPSTPTSPTRPTCWRGSTRHGCLDDRGRAAPRRVTGVGSSPASRCSATSALTRGPLLAAAGVTLVADRRATPTSCSSLARRRAGPRPARPAAPRRRTSHLVVRLVDGGAVVGPFVVPGTHRLPALHRRAPEPARPRPRRRSLAATCEATARAARPTVSPDVADAGAGRRWRSAWAVRDVRRPPRRRAARDLVADRPARPATRPTRGRTAWPQASGVWMLLARLARRQAR